MCACSHEFPSLLCVVRRLLLLLDNTTELIVSTDIDYTSNTILFSIVDYPWRWRLGEQNNNDDTSDGMNNATDDNSCLDYNKPKLMTNRDFVLLILLLKSSSCAPSYRLQRRLNFTFSYFTVWIAATFAIILNVATLIYSAICVNECSVWTY